MKIKTKRISEDCDGGTDRKRLGTYDLESGNAKLWTLAFGSWTLLTRAVLQEFPNPLQLLAFLGELSFERPLPGRDLVKAVF